MAWTGVVPPYAASTSYVYPYSSTSSSDGSWKVTLYSGQPSVSPSSLPLSSQLPHSSPIRPNNPPRKIKTHLLKERQDTIPVPRLLTAVKLRAPNPRPVIIVEPRPPIKELPVDRRAAADRHAQAQSGSSTAQGLDGLRLEVELRGAGAGVRGVELRDGFFYGAVFDDEGVAC